MKKNLLFLALMHLISIHTMAQQALWGGSEIVSPEINDDNSVTFRLHAPHANQVQLTGDWIPSEGWNPGLVEMEKTEDDLWIYTTEPLESNLYGYSFFVDKMRMNDPSNVYLIRDVATLTNVFIISCGQGDYYKVNDVPHGTITRQWYHSPENDKNRRITIYTPPRYETSHEEYPVLYLLHGMGGDEEAWMALGRTSQILDNLIAQGKAEPMIVVMPNGNVYQEAAPGESSLGFVKPTMQLPNTMDGKMEETFMDVINFVESNYRVKQSPGARAIAGLSMGGFHSLHISRYYPNTFHYIGLFSGAVFPSGDATSPVYKNLEETLINQKDNGYQLYWIAMGKTDFLYEQCVELRKIMDRINMPYTYRESEGGHTWDNWRLYLTEFVPMLFK
ncbi:esterase [Natronoflexus pectinivorans]|uniref:Enterochelin esterase family protein n=1 Tax=Natronoflexus pectinivorans TaxID=682526 RepID=A0A4R2GMM7_9BACT|nr:esterase [Natronoflexus pectinivorans]TCO10544.1 enterochelin esterase family protein [Natronoflexus pectinivorans]